MFTTKTLVTVLAVIAALHGYIYLNTEQVHPCRAAETRLLSEYGPLAFKVGLGVLGEGLFGKQYRPQTEQEQKLIKKSENVERLGVIGCYLPAVLGWKAVPPI